MLRTSRSPEQQAQLQDFFDRSAGGVIAQGCKSAHSVGCLYRGPNGTKCAIGHLIQDDVYRSGMDEDSVLPDVIEAMGLDPDDREILSLFSDMQYAHDGAAESYGDPFVNDFKHRMAIVADRFDLSTAALATTEGAPS